MYVVAHNASRHYGGIEIWIARLLSGLQRRGHRVRLYCRHTDLATRARAEGIETRIQKLRGDAAVWDAFAFARVLRADRPDALVLSTFNKIWLGGMAARLARVAPVVLKVANREAAVAQFKYAFPIRNWIDAVVTNNEVLCEPFRRTLPPTRSHRVFAIWDGVAVPARVRDAGAVRRELGLPAGTMVIGSVARLTRQKRFDRFVRVLASLPAHVHGVIAGEGDERDAIQALATSLGVGARMHLLGFRSDVGDVLAAFDVFMVTSDFEGLANAMLEAMAAGLPVVSTPVDGAGEALFASPAGSVPGRVTSWDDNSIVAATRDLIGDAPLRNAMSLAATTRARERFGFDRMLDEWETLLSAPAFRASRAR